ncbi:MAG: hypothetical protein ABIZ69_15395, partial [Ilumatobacteraceae bacterium]
MGAAEGEKPVHRVVRAVTTTKWGARAREVAASLKAQHDAGRDGDDSPAEPIWPTPREQLDAFKSLFRPSVGQAMADGTTAPPTADGVLDAALDTDA